MALLSTLGGIAGNLISGFFSKKAGKKAAQAQAQANRQNYEAQKEFAQSGVQWRVDDAKKAGVHPVFALGGSGASFSPTFQSTGDGGLAAAGQDIGRAVQSAIPSAKGKNQAYIKAYQDLSLKRMGLENELLASKIATTRQAGQVPRIPETGAGSRMLIDGQPGAGSIDERAMRRQTSHPTNKYQEAGAVADLGFLRTRTGYMPVYSRDAKDRLEDDTTGEIGWAIRNRVLPSFGLNYAPPPVKGRWVYNPITQEYEDWSRKKMGSKRDRPWRYMRR